jgi:hypothetical protein
MANNEKKSLSSEKGPQVSLPSHYLSQISLQNVVTVTLALFSIYLYTSNSSSVSLYSPGSQSTQPLLVNTLLDQFVDAARDRYQPDLFQDLDIGEFASHARILQDMWKLYLNLTELHAPEADKKLILDGIDRLGSVLYPWISKEQGEIGAVSELPGHFSNDRGIMVTAGAGQTRVLTHLIATTRYYFHCSLPIEVVYYGDGDLPPAHRDFIESIAPGVKCYNLEGLFGDPRDEMGMPGGWAIRPFAVLGSTFRNVMMCDADAIFLRDPTSFFDEAKYKETGTLFWRDRIIGPASDDKHDFVDYLIDRLGVKQKDEIMHNSMWFAKETDYELER